MARRWWSLGTELGGLQKSIFYTVNSPWMVKWSGNMRNYKRRATLSKPTSELAAIAHPLPWGLLSLPGKNNSYAFFFFLFWELLRAWEDPSWFWFLSCQSLELGELEFGPAWPGYMVIMKAPSAHISFGNTAGPSLEGTMPSGQVHKFNSQTTWIPGLPLKLPDNCEPPELITASLSLGFLIHKMERNCED